MVDIVPNLLKLDQCFKCTSITTGMISDDRHGANPRYSLGHLVCQADKS